MPDVPRGTGLQDHRPRSGLQCTHAGGHARLRELPRPGQGARRKRRCVADSPLQQDVGGRSRARPARRVTTVRRTRSGRAVSTISGTSAARPATASTRRRGRRSSRPRTRRTLCSTLPPERHQQDAPLQPHAGARRGDELRVVPQRARQHERQAAARPARRSTRAARAVTPTSADRICGSTRRSARAAPRATTRTGPTTTGCSSASSRSSASAVTSPHATLRRSTTGYMLNNSQNANKIYGRSCTICHQLVHGSNSPVRQDAPAVGEEDVMRYRVLMIAALLCLAPRRGRWRSSPPVPAPLSGLTGTVDVGGHVHRDGR